MAYKATSTEDGGYLIEDKRWSLPTAAKTARAPEDEVQEITIEMKEEKAIPSGNNKIISNVAKFFGGGGCGTGGRGALSMVGQLVINSDLYNAL